MKFNNNKIDKGIPVAMSLSPTLEYENITPPISFNKKRLLYITILAVLIAALISVIAKGLIFLINGITNIAFYGNLSITEVSPAHNSLGYWVIAIPVIGGILIGLMAFYGSKAIRGHGIPEAMEQILTNKSKIRPSITYLKPFSAAISIGTGGPFGAEGPIIATGGALGSTLGQILNITHNERKILLAAGATAGMSAIFGSPIAAIFLAIELLLFEFSPRSIIPVALACITGAAGHHLLFGSVPVFAIENDILTSSNIALFTYALIGISIGFIAILATKILYFIEDAFEHLPVHWMWWPAIGGLIVGIIGFFNPKTLGVGYENITEILSGNMPVQVLLSLCVLKFISWAVALGSGTSGGTLAPLLTIGGAIGALLASVILYFFPQADISISLSALVGMAAMFAGASRALLTSIIFALETTNQSNALLPLLSASSASYFISFFFMENTIMTEKISRRGIKTPDSYEPDLLEKITVDQVINENHIVLSEENTIEEVRTWLEDEKEYNSNYFVITSNVGKFRGIISSSNLLSHHHNTSNLIGTLIKRNKSSIAVTQESNLRIAVEKMAQENVDVLPVISNIDNLSIVGVLSYKEIISAYKLNVLDQEQKTRHYSLKRKSLKIILKGRNLMNKK